MNYLGIDPGAAGGMASVRSIGVVEIDDLCPMPVTEADVWSWFREMRERSDDGEFRCCIEKVGGYVSGSKGNIGSAMFKFGRGVGVLVGCLTAACIPFEEVNPATWQRALGIPPRKRTETKTQHKNKIKARAQALFPGVKLTLATCDAIMLAEYCRRKNEGRL